MEKTEKWSVGIQKSTVISNIKVKNTNFPSPPNPTEINESDLRHYGGYLICESIANDQHAKLLSAAPDLLEALINLFPHAQIIINENHPHYRAAVAAIEKTK